MEQNEFCNRTLFYWAWKGLYQIKLQLLSLSPRSLIKPDLIFPCTLPSWRGQECYDSWSQTSVYVSPLVLKSRTKLIQDQSIFSKDMSPVLLVLWWSVICDLSYKLQWQNHKLLVFCSNRTFYTDPRQRYSCIYRANLSDRCKKLILDQH